MVIAAIVAFVTLLPAFGERTVRRNPSTMQLSVTELRGKTLVTARHELRYAGPMTGEHVNDDNGDVSYPGEALDAPDGDGDDDPSAPPLRLGVALIAPPARRAPEAVPSPQRPGILLFRPMVRPG
jgi:hypothetical protein